MARGAVESLGVPREDTKLALPCTGHGEARLTRCPSKALDQDVHTPN